MGQGFANATIVATIAPTLGVSAAGASASTGTVIWSNSNNVSFGMAGSTITATASFPAETPFGVSAAGSSGSTGTVVFSNSNNVSFGMNGNTITATATFPAGGGGVAIAAVGSTATSGTVSFSNSNGISFGMNGQTVTAKMPTVSYWDNRYAFNANAATASSNAINLSIQRASLPFDLAATRVDVLGHLTVAGSTAGSYTMSFAAYTMSGSTASLASSASVGVTFSSGGATSNVSGYSGHSGTRWRSVPLATWNLTPGEYLFGFILSQAGPAGTTGSWTIYGNSSVGVVGNVGGGNAAAYFDDGMYSAGTAAFPASIHLTQINQTGTGVMRQPFIALAGTF